MSMELRRGIAINGPCGIMLEFRGNKPACSLGSMVSPDTGLGVALEFIKGYIYGLTVGLAHTIIATDQSGQGNRFRSGERRIPARPMLYRRNGLAALGLILLNLTMADELLARFRVFALGKLAEILRQNCIMQAVLRGELAVPFAFNLVALFPIILLGRSELFRVICLRLASAERLGNGQHASGLSPDVDRRRAIVKVLCFRSLGHRWCSVFV